MSDAQQQADPVPETPAPTFENVTRAVLQLLLDHAGINEDAVKKHLEAWFKPKGD